MKDKKNAVSPNVGTIKLENVSFKYDGSESLVLKNISMEILSMGMTNDYKIAIEEGATLIRVGSGIFGLR